MFSNYMTELMAQNTVPREQVAGLIARVAGLINRFID